MFFHSININIQNRKKEQLFIHDLFMYFKVFLNATKCNVFSPEIWSCSNHSSQLKSIRYIVLCVPSTHFSTCDFCRARSSDACGQWIRYFSYLAHSIKATVESLLYE